jgi:FKBP-type peptidyl-prolyl cis-trans isomerase
MKRLVLPIFLLMLAAACGGDDNSGPSFTPTTSAPYSQTDLVVGTGALAGPGSVVTVAYTGWLHDSSRPKQRAGSSIRTRPFSFVSEPER